MQWKQQSQLYWLFQIITTRVSETLVSSGAEYKNIAKVHFCKSSYVWYSWRWALTSIGYHSIPVVLLQCSQKMHEILTKQTDTNRIIRGPPEQNFTCQIPNWSIVVCNLNEQRGHLQELYLQKEQSHVPSNWYLPRNMNIVVDMLSWNLKWIVKMGTRPSYWMEDIRDLGKPFHHLP